MALSISAWALTTYQGQVVEAYKEADILGQPFVYRFDPGAANGLFPKIANRTVNSRADGSELTASNTTEGNVTVAFDVPEGVHELISYQQINTYNQQAPSQYAKAFGRQLAEKLQNNLVAYAIKVACGISTGMTAGSYRTDNNGIIGFDNEDTTGASISDAVFNVLAQMKADKVPSAGIIGAMYPKYFNWLRKRPEFASRDYVSTNAGNDQPKALDAIKVGPTTIYSLASIFNTDISSDTSYAAKYRVNASSTASQGGSILGVFWQDEALAVREAERPNGRLDDIADKNSWLVQARGQRGMESLQPTAFVALVGDGGS